MCKFGRAVAWQKDLPTSWQWSKTWKGSKRSSLHKFQPSLKPSDLLSKTLTKHFFFFSICEVSSHWCIKNKKTKRVLLIVKRLGLWRGLAGNKSPLVWCCEVRPRPTGAALLNTSPPPFSFSFAQVWREWVPIELPLNLIPGRRQMARLTAAEDVLLMSGGMKLAIVS